MSVAGLTANFLVSFGFVDAYSNYFNISSATGGAFTRDAERVASYVFPYNLGFILTSGGKLDLLGFSFFRISGWAHEPTSATLFVAPAMILLLHTKIIANLITKISMLAVISVFWFFAMSIGSLLAFIMLYSFYLTATLFVKIFPLKLTLSIGLVLSMRPWCSIILRVLIRICSGTAPSNCTIDFPRNSPSDMPP